MRTPFKKNISEKEIKELGITFFGYIETQQIAFSEQVVEICKGNVCRNYGRTWACPPAVGSFEQCKKRCLEYENAFVFASVYQLEDPFDYEGMKKGHREFKNVCDKLYEKLEKPFLLLSNEGCIRCKACTYPDAPCRFEEKLFPSLEGFGILVTPVAKEAKVPYNNGENTVTYFGMVCF
ncbi:MAG: DUF2284 domain-containing protein [Ruminococcaceae bacterium]|nr:DUF2284 domain-containing protein [Oscillospiraceae bacterium]